MEIYQAIILGILQGLTEWIPVSSSGHLAIMQNVFKLGNEVFFDVVLHIATLIVIIFFFREEIWLMIKAVFTWDKFSKYFRWAWFILAANIITGVIGITFKSVFESFFTSLLLIGIALIVNGLILQLSSLRQGFNQIDLKDSVLLGLAQGIAIIPGISRSGITITAGILRKKDREDVAKFSFLMSVPAIIGAGILQGNSFDWSMFSFWPFFVGFVFSGIMGYITLKWLMKIINKGDFYKFSYYCFGLGILSIILSFLI